MRHEHRVVDVVQRPLDKGGRLERCSCGADRGEREKKWTRSVELSANSHGNTVEEFLAQKRWKDAPPLFHASYFPADRRPLNNPYLSEEQS